jgi:hypothetical protein
MDEEQKMMTCSNKALVWDRRFAPVPQLDRYA